MKKIYFLLIALLCSLTMLKATVTYNVVANNDAWGTVTGSGEYNYLDTVTITATPSEGYYFIGWVNANGDIEYYSPTREIQISSWNDTTITYTAKFVEPVELTLNVETPGTLSDLIFDAGVRPIAVTTLTLTGTLNEDDFTLMRETMSMLVEVDLSGITNTSGVNFKNHKILQTITLPDGLTILEGGYSNGSSSGAFYYCRSLKSIRIPKTLTQIEDDVFSGCQNLQSVYISDLTAWCNVDFGGTWTYYNNNPMRYADNLYVNNERITDLVIPEGTMEISDYAFSNCHQFRSITIPESVKEIGLYAFENCDGITSVTIPNSVTWIDDYAFEDCNNLKTVTLGNSLKAIDYTTFSGYNSIDTIICISVNTPAVVDGYNSYSEIITEQFSFSSINVEKCVLKVPEFAYNSYVRHPIWGSFINIETMNISYYNISAVANDTVKGKVKGAKYYLPNEKVTLEAVPYDKYKFVKWNDGSTENPRIFTATQDCSFTAEFAIKPYEVMLSCDTIQGTVTGSGEYKPGTPVTISATAKEGYIFSYWKYYYEYEYGGGGYWTTFSYENPYTFEMGEKVYNIEAIFQKAKYEVDGIYYYLSEDSATVTSPNEGNYSGDIVIPETIIVNGNTYNVIRIESNAFNNDYITSVNIPASVVYIGYSAFEYCYSLQSVKFNSATPPYFEDSYSTFRNGKYGKRINVPCGATEAYENVLGTDDYWYFTEAEYVLNVRPNINDACYVEIQDNIGCNDNEATIYAYSYNNKYSFKQWSDGSKENPRIVTITKDTTFVAEFSRFYNVHTYSANENRGNVTGGGTYFEGDRISVVATPKEGYEFDYWYYYRESEYGEYYESYYYEDSVSFNVYNNFSVTAYFKITPTLIDGIYYYLDRENYSAVVAPSEDYTGDVVIPSYVTHNNATYYITGIESRAFESTSITSLTLPYLNKIEWSLAGCNNLVTLKANIELIDGCYGLNNCRNLKEIYVTRGTLYFNNIHDCNFMDLLQIPTLELLDLSDTYNTELPIEFTDEYFDVYQNDEYSGDTYRLHSNLKNLRKLVLPNGLRKIHDSQFQGLWLLEEIEIPYGVNKIPDAAFYDCHALADVTFNGYITSIGNYAFYCCHALENIVIPEGVTEIGDAAFYGCSYADEIVISSSVQSIGNNAFALCNQVERMEVRAITPPVIKVKTFYQVDRNIEFVVPAEARKLYEENIYWREFIQEIPTDVENADETLVVIYTQGGMLYVKGVETEYNVFDTSGRLVYTGRDAQLSLPRGVYVIAVGGEVEKVVL